MLISSALCFSGVSAGQPGRWAKDMAAFREQDQERVSDGKPVLFVGSSSLRLWDTLPQDFPGVPILNRGFGGSQLSDVLEHFDSLITPHHPAAIVLYEGDNDLSSGKTVEEFLADMESLRERLEHSHPGVPVGVLAIKHSPSRRRLLDQQHEANRRLAEQVKEWENWTFLDVATPLLLPNGEPDPLYYTRDRLHLNANGYRAWQQVLAPWIQEIHSRSLNRD
jgi:lysophospholipase L1-like esterase